MKEHVIDVQNSKVSRRPCSAAVRTLDDTPRSCAQPSQSSDSHVYPAIYRLQHIQTASGSLMLSLVGVNVDASHPSLAIRSAVILDEVECQVPMGQNCLTIHSFLVLSSLRLSELDIVP